MTNDIDTVEIFLRIFLTALISGLIGCERHVAHRPAGIRTNVLVGLGSTLVMMIAMDLGQNMSGVDPGRLAGQVLTGIGFIGAGIMFRFRGEPHGITTAATIFVVACIGLAVGVGQYLMGVVTGVFALITLRVIGSLEHGGKIHTHD
jgi:putative Mg2+ transporter-C (MgtC) family protein